MVHVLACLKNKKALAITLVRNGTTEATLLSISPPSSQIRTLSAVVSALSEIANKRTHNEIEKKKKQNKSKHRSGYNSYLHVVLDERVLDTLQSLSMKIQRDDIIQKLISKSEKNGYREDHNQEHPKEPPILSFPSQQDICSAVRYRSRSRSSLHMTFFFGGETLCKLSPNELQTWYDDIKNRFYKSGFYQHRLTYYNTCAKLLQFWHNTIGIRSNTSFRINRLRLFPPGKNYLIVAELEAVEASGKLSCWYNLHKDIVQIANGSSSPNIQDLYHYNTNTCNKWIPHITLGNIQTINRKVGTSSTPLLLNERHRMYIDTELTQLLRRHTSNLYPKLPLSQSLYCQAHGISMGGQKPKQIPNLNWEFKL